MIKIKPQKAFRDLYSKKWREFALHGGRGSGKSYEAAQYFIIRALNGSRVLCLREIQVSISESVHALLCDRIEQLGLMDYFDIQKTEINCSSGGGFLFKGMRHNIDSIKSMHNIDSVWIEEAQNVSPESINVLLPTIFRNKNPQILYTFNPTLPTDAVSQRFLENEVPDKAIVKQVSWRDNKYFSDDMKEEMDFNFSNEPDLANHIWEGEYLPSKDMMSVIPLHWLKKCVNAHVTLGVNPLGFDYVGFDIADTGKDHSSFVHRSGALIRHAEEFDNKYISDAVERVNNYCKDKSIVRVHYDSAGVGSGAKGDFNRIQNRNYIAEPFLGASKVQGYDKYFTDNITNGNYFRNLKAQAWWNIRLRVENTLRLLDGEQIDPSKCLFISENVINIDKLMLELSQAIYKHDDSKLVVDKTPDKQDSPNIADAVVLAFAQDLKKGLRTR